MSHTGEDDDVLCHEKRDLREGTEQAAEAACRTCLLGVLDRVTGERVIIDPEANQWGVCHDCGGTGEATGEGV